MYKYVYVLVSSRGGQQYVGLTENVEKRLGEHNSGKVNSTRDKKPWELIYFEAYLDKRDAAGREKFLKSGSGKRFLRKQLKHYFDKLNRGVEQSGSSQGS